MIGLDRVSSRCYMIVSTSGLCIRKVSLVTSTEQLQISNSVKKTIRSLNTCNLAIELAIERSAMAEFYLL